MVLSCAKKSTYVRKENIMSFLKKRSNLIALIVGLLVIAVIAIVSWTTPDTFSFAETLWAMLPPVVAIGLALITKEFLSVLSSVL